jgi:hypothetical protein
MKWSGSSFSWWLFKKEVQEGRGFRNPLRTSFFPVKLLKVVRTQVRDRYTQNTSGSTCRPSLWYFHKVSPKLQKWRGHRFVLGTCKMPVVVPVKIPVENAFARTFYLTERPVVPLRWDRERVRTHVSTTSTSGIPAGISTGAEVNAMDRNAMNSKRRSELHITLFHKMHSRQILPALPGLCWWWFLSTYVIERGMWILIRSESHSRVIIINMLLWCVLAAVSSKVVRTPVFVERTIPVVPFCFYCSVISNFEAA